MTCGGLGAALTLKSVHLLLTGSGIIITSEGYYFEQSKRKADNCAGGKAIVRRKSHHNHDR